MNKRFLVTVILFLSTTLAATVGCGPKRPAGLPQLYPTTITIKAEGKPVEGVMVRLYRATNESFAFSGHTNASGIVEIAAQTPVGMFKGAPEGELTVIVTKSINIGLGDGSSSAVEMISPEFTMQNTSPLRIQVAKGSNKAEFEVTAKPEAAEYLNQK